MGIGVCVVVVQSEMLHALLVVDQCGGHVWSNFSLDVYHCVGRKVSHGFGGANRVRGLGYVVVVGCVRVVVVERIVDVAQRRRDAVAVGRVVWAA